MPVGRQRRDPNRFPPSNPRVAVFTTHERPPDYKPNSRPPEPRPPVNRGHGTSPATLDRELEYFHAVASGAYTGTTASSSVTSAASTSSLPPFSPIANATPNAVTHATAPAATLVLHLFRATLMHIRPIAERLTLGAAAGAPYYATHATASTASSDAMDRLVVTRRHPLTSVYSQACVAEIQPGVNLGRPGMMTVAVLVIGSEGEGTAGKEGKRFNLTYGDRASLQEIGEAFSLWDAAAGKAVAHVYYDEGWCGLDEKRPFGIIRAKPPVEMQQQQQRPSGGVAGAPPPAPTPASATSRVPGTVRYGDPRLTQRELAYLDFAGTGPPQFVSRDSEAHDMMDLLVAAFFVIMTLETRRQMEVRELGSLPGYAP